MILQKFLISKIRMSRSMVFVLAGYFFLCSPSCLAADQYFDAGLKLSQQGKYADALPYFEYSVQKQKRSDNLYHRSLCLRNLGRQSESKQCLRELLALFPNSAEARARFSDPRVAPLPVASTNNKKSPQAISKSTGTAVQPLEEFKLDSRTMPKMPPLDDPESCERVKSKVSKQVGFSGVHYWQPEEVHDYLLRAEAQAERAEKVLEIAESNVKSHLRSKRYGESDVDYQNYVNNAQVIMAKAIDPYVSYARHAVDIHNSWVDLGNRLNKK